jgi:hypothetical protein
MPPGGGHGSWAMRLAGETRHVVGRDELLDAAGVLDAVPPALSTGSAMPTQHRGVVAIPTGGVSMLAD